MVDIMKKEPSSYDFSSNEESMLKIWEDGKYFDLLVEQNKNGPRFRFLDGPITANNPMGVHHAFGRTLKDVTIRYNAMQGKSCQYQNGFDAQGLWVEVEVEKSMGFASKSDIYKYGMDKFTDACMDRVKRSAAIITEQSKRLGQWMDWDHSYFTNTDENITAIWYFLKVCQEKGWLARRKKAMPWCPRCGTSLSEHEMTGAYKEVTCKAVFFKLPVKGEDYCMLVWTTTPWTLTSNCALAVNPEMDYAVVRVKSMDKLLVVVKPLVKVLKGDIAEIVKVVKGSEFVGKEYETCFPWLTPQNFTHKIVPWDAVDCVEGSGVVHIAPGCGAEDYELGLKYDIPQICPIDESGVILPEFGPFAGKTTVEVADDIFAALEKEGKLYYVHDYTHSYAHCWRCKTDIVFRLVDEWYLLSDELRPQLLEAIEHVEWQPEHLKKRMADWLNNMGDWNISRKRFYGLPLPFYICPDCGKLTVIGSVEELREKAVDPDKLAHVKNLHRPWIDEIKIKCDCGAEVSRIPEVGDCWLDAGITPFSTKKYFTDRKYWENNFPSDIVIEMVEQIRLWFYSQLFMSVVLVGKAPYKKVMCHGSVIQENGQKFSKSMISIRLEDAAKTMGADTIRYLYSGNNSIANLRFGYGLGDEAKRKLLALWNAYIFFNTYAVLDNPNLNFELKDEELTLTDKWLLQITNDFIADAKKAYEANVYADVLKAYEAYIDNLCNWYIRINRRRFWKEESEDKRVAYKVLYTAIKKTIQVMAPIIPFMTDHIWHNMVRDFEPDEKPSVHLSRFPEALDIADYSDIVSDTAKIREIIYMIQRLRNEHKIGLKQPLRTMYIKVAPDYEKAVSEFKSVILDEINVMNIEVIQGDSEFHDTRLTVNFKNAGAVLKKDVNKLKAYVANMSSEEVREWLKKFDTDGFVKADAFEPALTKDLFNVVDVPREGFAVENLGSNIVVLDLEIDENLKREGMLRKLIRQLQVCRKDAGYNIEDSIFLKLDTEDEDIKTILADKANTDKIASELLVVGEASGEDCYSSTVSIDGSDVNVTIKKA